MRLFLVQSCASACVIVLLLAESSGAFFNILPKTCFKHNVKYAPVLRLSAKKGFGMEENSKKKAKKNVPVAVQENTEVSMNAGQKALEELRRQRAEAKDAELRKVREMLAADKQVENSPATIPEKVAQRMGQRMLPFVGVPLFLAMGTFVAFWYFATYKNMEFQPTVVAGTTSGLLIVGLMGITYSVLSSSWDENREGSFLGTEEFERNINNIKEGLGRSRENAILREKMSGLSPVELQQALDDLEQREQAEAKRQKSLQSKLQEELD